MTSILKRISFRRSLMIAIFGLVGGYSTFGQSYCRPSLGSCCEWISNVSLGSINNNTSNESGYADYTSISTVVTKGVSYPINIKVSTNSIYVEHVKVFFDWDRDYIFESVLYLGSAKFAGNNIFAGEVTVPATAKNGCSMMRVFMQYAQQPSGACASLGDGEIEDYTIVVSNTSTPVAAFTFQPTPTCVKSPISFTSTSSVSDDAIMSHLWNFGDGTISTVANPTKTYASAGSYNVKLTTSTFCTSHTVTKTIVVNAYPTITLQPVSAVVCTGGSTSFNVAANSGATFKWQVNQGNGFIDVINGGVYSQASTSSLTITGATANMNGYQYRCLATTSCTVTSSAVPLVIQEVPTIESNPANVLVCAGGSTTFSVTAAGSGLSYQWQQNSGNGFTNLSNGGTFGNVTSRTLSINGILPAFHNYKYRCVVTGICASTSTSADLIVQENVAVTSHPVNSSVLEGTNVSFRIEASGAGIAYQWQENTGSDFVNVTNNATYGGVSSATLTIIDVPFSKDGFQYRCVVSGSCTTSLESQSAVLTVKSRVPTITSTAITNVREDLLYNYTITATDPTGGPLIYSAQMKPSWLSFNPTTHVLSGTPSNSDVGNHSITLLVSNGLASKDQNFSITVTNTNDAPTINSTAPTVVNQDATYNYKLVASDIDDGATLSYSAPEKPVWLTFNQDTQVLHGTPTNRDVGAYPVTLRVDDGAASVDQIFIVTVVNLNDAPVITSEAVVNVQEDSLYTYATSVADIDPSDVIVLSASVKPSWLTFDEASGLLTGVPSNSDVGSHQVTLQANDGHVKIDQSFTVVVHNVNDTPVITSLPVISADEDKEYRYTITAIDIDRDQSLTYVIVDKPDWLSFNTSERLLYGTPTNDDVGSHVIKLQVHDGIVGTDQTFTLSVNNLNDPPSITSVAEISVEEGAHYNYVLTAVDEDPKDILRYAAVTKPAWLTFNTNTGALNGIPEKQDVGVYPITLRVNDGIEEVDQSFTISVTNTAVPVLVDNLQPTQLSFSTTTFESSISLNEALGIFVTVDADDMDHTYTFVNGDGDGNNNLFSLEDNKLYVISIQTISDATSFSIRVKSTDPHGNSIEAIFYLEKIESNSGDIQIPTTFSPDGDGVNDTWVVQDLKQFKDVSIQVFDRSGVPLYASNDPEQGWDGRVKGGSIIEGPFFYIIKIHDTLAVKKGILIVIR